MYSNWDILTSAKRPMKYGLPASPRAWVAIRWMASAEDRLVGTITYLHSKKNRKGGTGQVVYSFLSWGMASTCTRRHIQGSSQRDIEGGRMTCNLYRYFLIWNGGWFSVDSLFICMYEYNLKAALLFPYSKVKSERCVVRIATQSWKGPVPATLAGFRIFRNYTKRTKIFAKNKWRNLYLWENRSYFRESSQNR
jgi:hypothetical protein